MKISKQFIPYEQALELKELGFNEMCIATYDEELELETQDFEQNYNTFPKHIIAAPIWQQVFDWFRENHRLNCYISQSTRLGLVEKHIPNGITGSPTPYKWYRDYTESIGSSLDYPFLDPLESFFSALEADGLFLNGNPYSKPDEFICGHKNPGFEMWQEAEARTFDKTRTILLVKN